MAEVGKDVTQDLSRRTPVLPYDRILLVNSTNKELQYAEAQDVGGSGGGGANQGPWKEGLFKAGGYVMFPSEVNIGYDSRWYLIGEEDYYSEIPPNTDPDHWVELPEVPGPKGDAPEHQWNANSEVRFQNPDGSWGPYVPLKGEPGREVEFNRSATYIQWRYVGEANWNNLVSLSDLKGDTGDKGDKPDHQWNANNEVRFQNPDGSWGPYVPLKGEPGREVEFNKSATYIQWRYVGEPSWTDLVLLIDLKGEKGDGLKIDESGLLSDRDQYDSEPVGFVYLATDEVPSVIYQRQGAAGNWSDPIPFQGPRGRPGLDAPTQFGTTAGTVAEGNDERINNGQIAFEEIANKVDKVSGKQLTDENYTSAEKSKLAGINMASKADLDGNNKILFSQIPDVVLGQVKFGGTFNNAGTISPSAGFSDISNVTQIDNVKGTEFNGFFFISTGTFIPAGSSITSINVGDWLVVLSSNVSSTSWEKIDNTDAVQGILLGDDPVPKLGLVQITAASIGASTPAWVISQNFLKSVLGSDLGIEAGAGIRIPSWDRANQEWTPGYAATQAPSSGSLVIRRSGGQGPFADATQSDEAITLGQGDGRYSRQAVIGYTGNSIVVLNTAAANETPTERNRGAWFDFKQNSGIGLTGQGTYSAVTTVIPWSDNSGNTNVAYRLISAAGKMFVQHWDGTAWGPIRQLFDEVNPQIYKVPGILTANKTLSGTDRNAYIRVTGTRNISIPASLSLDDFPIGETATVRVSHAATVNFIGASGVTTDDPDGSGVARTTTVTGRRVVSIVRLELNAYDIVY